MGGATLIRQAASNWSVSGVATIQTGVPHTITDSPGGSIFGFASTSRAQLCPGVTYDNISTPGSVSSRINNYCNTAAFCAVPMIGNGNRLPGAGIVRGADQNNIDLWITKAFKVAERHTFELRSEFFQRSEPCAIFDSGNGVRRGEFWRHRVDFGDCPVDSVRIEV